MRAQRPQPLPLARPEPAPHHRICRPRQKGCMWRGGHRAARAAPPGPALHGGAGQRWLGRSSAGLGSRRTGERGGRGFTPTLALPQSGPRAAAGQDSAPRQGRPRQAPITGAAGPGPAPRLHGTRFPFALRPLPFALCPPPPRRRQPRP